MVKVSIIGHFANGEKNLYDGQTIKTHNVYNALYENIGKQNVMTLDTYGGLKFFVRMPIVLYKALIIAKNIYYCNLLFKKITPWIFISNFFGSFVSMFCFGIVIVKTPSLYSACASSAKARGQ